MGPADVAGMSDADLNTHIQHFDDWPADAKKGLTADQIGKHFDALAGKESQLDAVAYSDAASKQTGTKATIETGKGDVNGKPLVAAQMESGEASGMRFGNLPEARFGEVVVSNARDVVVTPSRTCGAHADGLIVGRDVQANVDEFCVRDNTVSFDSADFVSAKCASGAWMALGAREAVLTADAASVSLASNLSQEVSVRDCVGNDVNLSLRGGSRAAFARDGTEWSLTNATTTLAGQGFIVTDRLESNGTARVVLDRNTRQVVYVEMQPTFAYDLRTGVAGTDFGFVARAGESRLLIRRNAGSPTAEALGCADCSVVDLPNRTITLVGRLEYRRKFVGPDGREALVDGRPQGLVTIYKSDNPQSRSTLSLDEDFVTGALVVEKDAPTIVVNASNYLSILERAVMVDGKQETHRLVGVNEKLTKEQLTVPIIRAYRTAYSPARMTLGNNRLDYLREGGTGRTVGERQSGALLNVTVLPPGDQGIGAQEALLPLALVLFLPAALFRKKAQVSVFVLLGIVVLLAFALLLVAGGAVYQYFGSGDVQKYAQACLQTAAEQGVREASAWGGEEHPPAHVYFDGKARPLDSQLVAENTARLVQANYVACISHASERLPGYAQVENASANVRVTLAQEGVVVRAAYPVKLKNADRIVTLNEQVANIPYDMLRLLRLATVTAYACQNTGYIDLDALYGPSTAIFVPKDGLRAYYYDSRPQIGQEWAFTGRYGG